MLLIPDDIRERLLANGAAEPETDAVPVVKLFDPCGAATWLLTEMLPQEPDIVRALRPRLRLSRAWLCQLGRA